MTEVPNKPAGAAGTPINSENLRKLLRIFDDNTGLKLTDGQTEDGYTYVSQGRKKFAEPTSSVLAPPLVSSFYVDTRPSGRPNPTDFPLIPPSSGIISARPRPLIGGVPITLEIAVELRRLVYGSLQHSFSREWKKSGFLFQDISSPFCYGLITHRCGSRGMVLCVQAFLLQHLIFEREYQSSIMSQSILQPNEFERRRALIRAMCDILWRAGDRRRSYICLQQDCMCFRPDYRIREDKVTEYIHIFEFRKYQDLEMFMKRNLSHFEFENINGCILFLYSVVLSRGIDRVREDMEISGESRERLLGEYEECTQPLLNLLLTGRAIQHLHNGNMVYNSRGKLLPRPLPGVRERNCVGFLYFDKDEREENRKEVGSMLKVPKCPIWVTYVNGQPGLLFSTNQDLVNDWRAEHRFTLHYYTGLPSHKPTKLSIDTRFHRNNTRPALSRKVEEERVPSLERCIMTKWYGADIQWNGVMPFI